ncbi:MAG: MFS transporter [Ignavibacteriae bacterium]|nr:MFS transporter [Ignavibacteriota bacterium]MCB9215105.1 MFS transporter [Ignavibacteria bacterium]
MSKTTATRGTIFSWALFDFANTSFYVIIITLVFPLYFTNVLAGENEAVWTRTISISMLLTALIGPVLGSIADATNRKKFFLGIFTVACILATTALYWVTGPALLGFAIVLLIIANVGFEGGTIFYDAFLPEIAEEKDYARVSAFGWAVGYAGSFLILGAVLPILMGEPTQDQVRLTFLIAAGSFALFSLPMFLKVPEEARIASRSNGSPIREGYRRLRQTFTHLRSYKDIVRFLAAFFIYNDGILTVIALAAIFMNKTLGFTTTQQIIFFMIVQATALGGSILFGRVADRIGSRATLFITLSIWIVVVIVAYFVQDATAFFVVGGIAGLALGSSQSTSRTLMALLTPEEKKTEFFGFYDGFFGKASAVLGPLIFGEVAITLGQRPAMLVIGVMFVIGMLLLARVPDVRPQVVTAQSD